MTQTPPPPPSGLCVDIATRQGDFDLETRFQAPPRGLTALFGPSGAGKSTVLALIAGLRRPARGRITLDGRVLFDAAARINLPPERRGIGYVFQDALLFPHLTVLANLRYGIGRMAPAQVAPTVDRLVDLLDIRHLLHRRPPGLSGGEMQRVAIGRALLSGPRLLLMDEPLAALDSARKAEILPYIEAVRDQWGIPILYVSHALPEILRLANHAVRLERGRVAADGELAQTLTPDLPSLDPDMEPASVLDMVVGDRACQADIAADGLIRLTLAATGAAGPGPGLLVAAASLPAGAAAGQPCRVRVAASDVAVARIAPLESSFQNILPARVLRLEDRSMALVDVALELAPGQALWARITRHAQRQLALSPGDGVYALVKAATLDSHGVVPVVRTGAPPG